MKIDVHDNTQLSHIQESLNSLYPNLWINFFLNNGLNASGHEKLLVNTNMRVKDLPQFKGATTIDISGERQVLQLQKDIEDALGLTVTTLRRSGKVWVQTLYTGNWSLESQNFEGSQISFE